MNSIQLYASVTATGQTYVDLPQGGRIKGVVFTATSVAGGAGDTLNLEVSLVSTNQTAVSDARSIAAIGSFQGMGGGSPASAGHVTMSIYCPSDTVVKSGDRLYLNYTEAGTGTWLARALVFY